jgi:2'-hydroxyisoflavone reductase
VSPPPPFGFGQLLAEIAAQVSPAGTRLTWVASDFLRAAGEDSDSLPLWPGGDDETDINAADPAAADAAGLSPRPLRQTIADVCAEYRDLGGGNTAAGISAEHEAELFARWDASAR